MYEGKKVTAVIVAAGSGTRMKSAVPKQFLKIEGKTILEKTVSAFEKNNHVDQIIVMTGADYVDFCKELCSGFSKICGVFAGGAQRQDTVCKAVNMVEDDQLILIHDGVRPFVTYDVIDGVIFGAYTEGAAVPAVACKDTVRQIDEAPAPISGVSGGNEASGGSKTLDRSRLFQVQTPQGFRSELLKSAYKKAEADNFQGTDDASLVERLGVKILLSEGDYANIKITTREDLPMEMRVGSGFDVHKLVEGRKLILGGVEIPYEKGLDGHSDADVMVHALMDAMLGAAGLGDIGRHFPDTDPQYKGISSLKLLEIVNERLKEAGYCLSNADVTIIAQRPKLAGYIAEMEENLAKVLGAEKNQINVKATTTEKLGFTGRGEGIASEAVCMIRSL